LTRRFIFTLACLPLALLLGCSQSAPVSGPSTGGTAGTFNAGGGESAAQIQARIDAVKANTQATDEQKQMVLAELQHAQTGGAPGAKPAGQ